MKESFFPSEEGLQLRCGAPTPTLQRLLSESSGGKEQSSVETRHQDGERQLEWPLRSRWGHMKDELALQHHLLFHTSVSNLKESGLGL